MYNFFSYIIIFILFINNMSGGIFPNYPFHFNIKCIIFTLLIALGYWYLPQKNPFILIFLLWFPYIALAWYDYSYKCQNKIVPTLIPFGRYIWLPFKPQGYKDKFNKLPPRAIHAMDTLDHITGWTIFLIIFVTISWYIIKHLYTEKQKNNKPNQPFQKTQLFEPK